MSDTTSVGSRLRHLEVGPEFDTYTQVIIHVGQITDSDGNTKDLNYVVGNTSGRTLEVTDPFGTQAKANALLEKLQSSAWQYQPYTAEGALLDPAAEVGDGVTLSGTYSAIYKGSLTFSTLMAQNLSAPSDEEIDHEFRYIPKENREYKREVQFARSQLKINANEISAEVSRATEAEGDLSSRITLTAGSLTTEITNRKNAETQLSSRITQNATDISARVAKTSGNNTIGFGWNLSDSEWKVGPFSSGSVNPVLTINKNGLSVKGNGEFSGKITATTGYIGNGVNGFTISSKAIYNGVTSMTDTAHNGLYLGTDGIRLGKGNFSVSSAGEMTAKKGYIGNGTNGFTISSNAIYNGKSSFAVAGNGIYLGVDGIALGDGTNQHSFSVYKSGAMTVRYGMTSLNDTTNNGMFIGTDGIAFGKGNFKVTSAGQVTAKNLNISGGSINLGNGVFKVTSTGAVTASNLSITGGTIHMKDAQGATKFYVTGDGDVIARNMILRGTLTMQNASGGNAKYISADSLAQYAYNSNDWLTTPVASYGGVSAGTYAVGGAGAGYSAQTDWSNARNAAIGAGTLYGNFVGGVRARGLQIATGDYGGFVNIGLWSGTIGDQPMNLVVWQ